MKEMRGIHKFTWRMPSVPRLAALAVGILATTGVWADTYFYWTGSANDGGKWNNANNWESTANSDGTGRATATTYPQSDSSTDYHRVIFETVSSVDTIEVDLDGNTYKMREIQVNAPTKFSNGMIRPFGWGSQKQDNAYAQLTLGESALIANCGHEITVTNPVEVEGTTENPSAFYSYGNYNMTVSGNLTGTGYLKLRVQNDRQFVVLSGNNGAFAGTVEIPAAESGQGRRNYSNLSSDSASSALATWIVTTGSKAADARIIAGSGTWKFGRLSGKPNLAGSAANFTGLATIEIGEASTSGETMTIDDDGNSLFGQNEYFWINGGRCNTMVVKKGAGTLDFGGRYPRYWQIEQGTVILQNNYSNANPTDGYIAFTGEGATLKLGTSFTTDVSTNLVRAVSENMNTQPMIVDDGGVNRTWEVALTGTSFTKQGSGTLTLKESPLYTGTTTVSGGTLVIPACTTLNGNLVTSGGILKIDTSSTYVTADTTLLTVTGDASGATVIADGYTISGTYDGTSSTLFKATAYIGDDYVTFWRQDFENASAYSSDLSGGDIVNMIFDVSTDNTWNLSGASQINRLLSDGTGSKAFQLNNNRAILTFPQNVQAATDYILTFDWYAGSGYTSGKSGISLNGLDSGGESAIAFTVMVPFGGRSGGKDYESAGKIYKSDDSTAEICNITGSYRGNDPSLARTGYWYTITVKGSSSGVSIAVEKYDGTVVLEETSVSDTFISLKNLYLRAVTKNYECFEAIDNVEVKVPKTFAAVEAPTITTDTSSNITKVSLTAAPGTENGASLYVKVTADGEFVDASEPIEVPNSAWIYYYEMYNGVASEIKSTFVYSNLEAVQLAPPTAVYRRGVNRIYVTTTQATILGRPTPTIMYKSGVMAEAAEVPAGETAFFEVEGLDISGTVDVWVMSNGYADSEKVTYALSYPFDRSEYGVATEIDYADLFASGKSTSWATEEVDNGTGGTTTQKIAYSGNTSYKGLLYNGERIYDPFWYTDSSYDSGNPRWTRNDYGLHQDNNGDQCVLIAGLAAGTYIWVSATTEPGFISGSNLTKTESGNGEWFYTVNEEGDVFLKIARYHCFSAIRIFAEAAAKVNGVGYVTVDAAIAAAAESGGSVEVVDDSTLSGQNITLKPGVAITGLGETSVGNISITTTIGGESVDMTSYYKSASLAVVNGTISPELDEAVAPAVDTTSEEPMTMTESAVSFAVDTTSLKKGLYYGVGTRTTPNGTVTHGAMTKYDGTNAGNIDFTAALPDSGVKYYTIEASDTDLTP